MPKKQNEYFNINGKTYLTFGSIRTSKPDKIVKWILGDHASFHARLELATRMGPYKLSLLQYARQFAQPGEEEEYPLRHVYGRELFLRDMLEREPQQLREARLDYEQRKDMKLHELEQEAQIADEDRRYAAGQLSLEEHFQRLTRQRRQQTPVQRANMLEFMHTHRYNTNIRRLNNAVRRYNVGRRLYTAHQARFMERAPALVQHNWLGHALNEHEDALTREHDARDQAAVRLPSNRRVTADPDNEHFAGDALARWFSDTYRRTAQANFGPHRGLFNRRRVRAADRVRTLPSLQELRERRRMRRQLSVSDFNLWNREFLKRYPFLVKDLSFHGEDIL